MLREHLTLIEEAVSEGSNRGIQSFLETLDQDMKVDEIIEESGGIDEVMKQLFLENGYTATEVEMEKTEVLEENDEQSLDAKIDSILDSLKKEGIVD